MLSRSLDTHKRREMIIIVKLMKIFKKTFNALNLQNFTQKFVVINR